MTTSSAPASLAVPATRLSDLPGLYAELTKLRLSALVVATTAAGFALGSAGREFDWPGLFFTILGTALSALGANGLNQWLERGRDARMERTRHRPLPSGRLSGLHAAAVSAALVAAGVAVLALATNRLTTALDLVVVVLYVAVYTPMKSKSALCTLVGAVVGANPPMMGVAAATGSLGPGAYILFGFLFAWQIPHFLALAWLYREDYERGGYRMLTAIDGSGQIAFRMIVLYTLALLPLGLVAYLTGITGFLFACGSIAAGAVFLWFALRLWWRHSELNARRVFFASLLYLPLILVLLVLDRAPPAVSLASVDGARGGVAETHLR